MSGLILIVMLVVMVVVLFVKLVRQKPVKNLLISYAVILGGYHLLVSSKCGPDRSGVKIMKPQAEVITNYILKHGIPKSMTEIPNLPYKLDNCERETFYAKNHPNYTEGQSEEATDDEVLKEKCTFIANDRKYEVSIRFSVAYKQQYIILLKTITQV